MTIVYKCQLYLAAFLILFPTLSALRLPPFGFHHVKQFSLFCIKWNIKVWIKLIIWSYLTAMSDLITLFCHAEIKGKIEGHYLYFFKINFKLLFWGWWSIILDMWAQERAEECWSLVLQKTIQWKWELEITIGL